MIKQCVAEEEMEFGHSNLTIGAGGEQGGCNDQEITAPTTDTLLKISFRRYHLTTGGCNKRTTEDKRVKCYLHIDKIVCL